MTEDRHDYADLEDINKAIAAIDNNTTATPDHGWQKVSYPKRQRKASSNKAASSDASNGGPTNKSNVFRSIEQHAEDRRRRTLEAQKAAAAAEDDGNVIRSKPHHWEDDDGDYSDDAGAVGNAEPKKQPKQKKPKKPKVTVPEAASKMDASDLAAFLVDTSASYESQQDIQLMRFADYFARAFSLVGAAQFPWTKIFKESSVAKLADIPLNDLPEPIYKTSVDWIALRSSDALSSFILWCLDTIVADTPNQQPSAKASKKVPHPQHAPSKAQVAIFVVLAMVLRRKPDALISLLPILRDDKKYQGQDKLPIIVWAITQVCQGDLAVGMFSWVQNLLPIISTKSCNPQSRDLILQSLERILSAPKARSILLNGAVRKGERLVPPSAFEMLMRATFPAPSARVKATERFEVMYPTLKDLALAGMPGSKAMKQVTQQIFSFAVKAAGEGNAELSKEATSICIWCLTQNPDCYKQWDKIYLDNLEASVSVLKKLSEEWKEHRAKHASLESVKEVLQSFRQKNEKALSEGDDTGILASIRSADKYCKGILGKLYSGHGCMKGLVFAVAVGVGAYVLAPNMELWDWNKMSVMFSSP